MLTGKSSRFGVVLLMFAGSLFAVSMATSQTTEKFEFETRSPDGTSQDVGREITRNVRGPLDSDEQLLNDLINFINEQAQAGRYPNSDPFLEDIDRLVRKYSFRPKEGTVRVTNQGVGRLRLEIANGFHKDLWPNQYFDCTLEGQNRIKLMATEEWASCIVKFDGKNGNCQFYDGDDNKYYPVTPNKKVTRQLDYNPNSPDHYFLSIK